MSVKTFAAIDVGSFELTMKIFEFSGKNRMREIDCVSKHLDLGSDTYAQGRIGNDKMDELCRILKDFADICRSYRVEAYRAYGTSAIREMENSTVVRDQIKQRTGISLDIRSSGSWITNPSPPRGKASGRLSRRRRRSWISAVEVSRFPCLIMIPWYPPRTCGWVCCGFRNT